MGNAAFWFYPSGAHLVTINLGEQLGELFTDFEVDAATGTSLSGRMRRVVGLQREIITTILTGADLVHLPRMSTRRSCVR